jgi:hypothetical protein
MDLELKVFHTFVPTSLRRFQMAISEFFELEAFLLYTDFNHTLSSEA